MSIKTPNTNKTEWCYNGKVQTFRLLGLNAIFFGSGCHLNFIDLTTKQTHSYKANNARCGDGIRYIVGHRTLDFFAFAENCGNPNIFVMSYPKFETIAVLEDGSKEGYVSLTFSESSLLISLGALPYFTVTVWNWRKGEKLGSSKSHIHRINQIIRCNIQHPVKVSQFSRKGTKLHVWDILVCGKKCIMKHNKVRISQDKPSPLVLALWSVDNVLYVLDYEGNLFMVNSDYIFERVIAYNKPGVLMPTFVFWRGNILITGPSTEIRLYVKSGNAWNLESVIEPSVPLVRFKCNRQDILIGLTANGNLVRIEPETRTLNPFESNETEFHDVCMVYPVGQYVCLLSQGNMVNVVEIATGSVVSKYTLRGTALTMTGNPEFPYIAVGYINGILELISLYNPLNPASMVNFNLTTNRISSVHFSEFGRVLVAADTAVGEFFILEGIPGGHIKIVTRISTHFQIVDYMLVSSTDCYRLFVIPVTSRNCIKGDKVVRYCIMANSNKVSLKEYAFRKTKFYTKMVSTSKINRDRVFYLLPFNAKYVEEVEIPKGESHIRVLNKYYTGHQVCKNQLYIDKHHVITWARDGFAIARSLDFETVVGVSLAHHRRDGGVRKAYIDPMGKYIITLGNENIVACTNLVANKANYQLHKELIQTLNSNRYSLLFQRKTTGYDPGPEFADYTWHEMQQREKNEAERLECQEEKDKIMSELKKIRKELRLLLDQNLDGPENERLDLVEFNLNTNQFNEIKEANRVECKEIEEYIRKYVKTIYKVCENIKKTCYDSMSVHVRKILAIAADLNVENFALLPPDGEKMEHLEWVKEQLKLERFVNSQDYFEAWKPSDVQKRLEFLKQSPKIPVPKTKNIEDFEEEAEPEKVDNETVVAMCGSTARNYIEIWNEKYDQAELQTFYQLELLSAITENDCVRLREYFNKEFENLVQRKVQEMNQIKERNARLRHIVDEINYFSTDQIFISIIDPAWSMYEDADLMVTVKDSQVPIQPYVSPSEQAILDAKAAEAERIRLLLLADDFKERALMAMMNGVLEVRWEDELKKDVPLPKCMLEKEPEDFNEDDLRAVKDYEDKVKFLQSERERYKYLLDKEYEALVTQMRVDVTKFDERVANLLHLRIKIDEAKIQETLILSKESLKLIDRVSHNEKELELKSRMVNNEELIRGIENIIQSLHDTLIECRNQVEIVQTRDKILEKNYKKDMSEFNQVVQEAAVKIMKRRPKISYKNISSYTMLRLLAKAVATRSPSPVLSQECLDYLKALNHLDAYVSCPPGVDEKAFELITRHRRLKIEQEIKVKTAYTAIAEAETTVQVLNKRLTQRKEHNVLAMDELSQVRTDRLKRMKNFQMQIVLKQGYVEVPLNGNIADFQDAILISRKEVEEINAQILENGRLKLNMMKHTMTFHREIMKMEWLHKKMRMHIEDLREELNDVNNLKMTKEMQVYLKGREKVLPFEVELELLKKSYEMILNEKRLALAKMKKQINILKDHNKKLDGEISDINVDVCECKLDKDWDLDEESMKLIQERIVTLAKRSKMIRKVQENHQSILLLQTELELLRLRTYPTIKYKILRQNSELLHK